MLQVHKKGLEDNDVFQAFSHSTRISQKKCCLKVSSFLLTSAYIAFNAFVRYVKEKGNANQNHSGIKMSNAVITANDTKVMIQAKAEELFDASILFKILTKVRKDFGK